MPRILVIDDDEALRATIEQLLVEEGYTVKTAGDGVEAAKLFRSEPFDLIMVDMVMPNREGIETLIELRRDFPKIVVIAMSGSPLAATVYLKSAKVLGAHRTLLKPFSDVELLAVVGALLPEGEP